MYSQRPQVSEMVAFVLKLLPHIGLYRLLGSLREEGASSE